MSCIVYDMKSTILVDGNSSHFLILVGRLNVESWSSTLLSSVEGRVFGARITDLMFKIEARMEDVVHAGKAEAPFAGVDFSLTTGQRGQMFCCTKSIRWNFEGEVSFRHPSR